MTNIITPRDWTLLFVYNYPNPSSYRGKLLTDAVINNQAKYLYMVQTVPLYDLIDFGTFPALTNGSYSVGGELYTVSPGLLEVFDDLEGNPTVFKRQPIKLWLDDLLDHPQSSATLEIADAYIFNIDNERDYLINVISSGNSSNIKQISKTLKVWWEL